MKTLSVLAAFLALGTAAFVPRVALFVPREMREKDSLTDGSTVESKAAYAKCRRYQVKVDENIAPIIKQ